MQWPRPVGIIANPASGKDIRRLVAQGSVFDNNEKINIVRRVVIALDQLGIADVHFMPDTYGIVQRAQQQAKSGLSLHALPMAMLGNASDSLEAAQRLRDLDVACVVTLGGDGTNRVVARGIGSLPLIPVSTGTNNVFPHIIEGTLAGMAAAVVATGLARDAISRRPRLEVSIDGRLVDSALVDVVRSNQQWIGSRALWKPDHIQEVVLSHRPHSAIGICSLAPLLLPDGDAATGLHVRIGDPGRVVVAPIAPGVLAEVPVADYTPLKSGETVRMQQSSGTIALDGEREIELRGPEVVDVTLSGNGPYVVDIDRTISAGSRAGFFDR